MNLKAWIEAMRLRTLPVSVAGVVAGAAYALCAGAFRWSVVAVCLAFAVMAQIASNFANEYFDFAAGLDRPGREGPRRGVTEGDISPSSMRTAAFVTLALACAVGLCLLFWGPWWIVIVGAVLAVGALAYSAGPYPLARHGLGEVAVLIFFGIAPVNLTFFLQTGFFDISVLLGSLSLGLMGANVLIVNNYRDMEDDAHSRKFTLAVLYGRRAVATMYLFNGYIAVALMCGIWMALPPLLRLIPIVYLMLHTQLWIMLGRRRGADLNPLLGLTSVAMLVYALGFAAAAACA